MQLKAAAALLVWATFYYTLSLEGYTLNDDEQSAIELKGTIEAVSTIDEENPREDQPTSTMGDEVNPREADPTGTMGDEESPREVQPTGTMGNEEVSKEGKPSGTKKPIKLGDEEIPVETRATGTMGDEENWDKESLPAADSSDNIYPNAAERSQNIALDSVDTSYDGGDTSDVKRVLSSECRNYRQLNEYHRAQGYSGVFRCDRGMSAGWYRFTGLAGSKMPTSCVPKLQCGTSAPGWMVGAHPTRYQGAVSRRVCFHWTSGCCHWYITIRVRNCGAFYVYYLPELPLCNLRYCGDRYTPNCGDYKYLSESSRRRSQTYNGVISCDNHLQLGWYRFGREAGYKMADSCVPTTRCGTLAPGWLAGGHPPSVAHGTVVRKVCFHWTNGCCHWSKNIIVRNCGPFYVYYMSAPPTCYLRYCGNS